MSELEDYASLASYSAKAIDSLYNTMDSDIVAAKEACGLAAVLATLRILQERGIIDKSVGNEELVKLASRCWSDANSLLSQVHARQKQDFLAGKDFTAIRKARELERQKMDLIKKREDPKRLPLEAFMRNPAEDKLRKSKIDKFLREVVKASTKIEGWRRMNNWLSQRRINVDAVISRDDAKSFYGPDYQDWWEQRKRRIRSEAGKMGARKKSKKKS